MIEGCGICGGGMVFIRGRYPGMDKRIVCPTCLAERIDEIKMLCDPDYGQAGQAIAEKEKK